MSITEALVAVLDLLQELGWRYETAENSVEKRDLQCVQA